METNSFFLFFDGSPAAVVLASRTGAFLAANKKGETLLASLPGESPEAGASGGRLLERALLDSGEYGRLVSGETGEAVFPLAVQTPDGLVRWFKIFAWVIPENLTTDMEEKPRLALIIRDETRERQEETRLHEARRNAEQSMEAKSQFLANMSHEIRTPIQTIIGMTELLQDTKLDREQAEYSRQVKFSADVLLSLINDILDYSKIEAGKMVLEHIDFDLEQTIEQAVEMISLEAHKKGLEIALDIPPDTAIFVKGDPSKYRQIVINLVKNAVKFTREGGITITVALTEWEGQDAVRMSVADTGVGVPEEMRNRLFTTFFQVDPSNTRQFGGTGLGLAISRNLVGLMHGVINMIPNEGGGSIFRFTVPIERSGIVPDTAPITPLRHDIHILVVDDRPESRRILVSYLQDIGYYEVDVAVSGEEALTAMRAAAARKRPFDLCFLDMIMPQMDGWRLAAEINGDKEINSALLVLMVPHGLLGADAKMTLLKWFNAYINKPIKRNDLIRTLEEVLADPAEELEPADEPEAAGSETSLPADIPRAAVTDAPASQSGDMKPGANALILVVEDHPVNQNLFALILEKLGYPVVLADDGLDALEKAAAHPVSLIFMDIQMPRMNGYEAAGRLRQQGFRNPIIAVTASALSGERERCMSVGFDDMLIKPFKRPDIEKMLQVWPPGKALSAYVVPVDSSAAGPEAGPFKTGRSASEPEAGSSKTGPEDQALVSGQIFDRAEVTETFMDNAEMIRSLLIRFIERTGEQIDTVIPQSIAAGDWDAVRLEAHTIKGSALTLTAKDLGQTAARLELACKNVNISEINTLVPPLKTAFFQFEKEARRYLDENSGGGGGA
jgi:signal transduction histidine kinase/DNA-binding response OmpR family regulator/HPt (histidine-containing phosphotransfer) domain-containing protein